MDGKGIFKTVKFREKEKPEEKKEPGRAAESEKVEGSNLAKQEIKAPGRTPVKDAERSEKDRLDRIDRTEKESLAKDKKKEDWMDEVEEDSENLDEVVKNAREEEAVVLPSDRTKTERQSVKAAPEKEEKKKGTEDIYTRQKALDDDSIKSGNQIGSMANERAVVEQSLDVYAVDGFDNEHDELMEDIRAKEVSLDDQEAIQKAEKDYLEEDDDLEALLAADDGEDIAAEETKVVYEEEEQESKYPEIDEDVFDKGMERKSPWES